LGASHAGTIVGSVILFLFHDSVEEIGNKRSAC